jgi:CDP-diglyceride synthetase
MVSKHNCVIMCSFFISTVNLKFICLHPKRVVGACVYVCIMFVMRSARQITRAAVYAPPFSFIANNALCFPAIDFRPRALAYMCVRVCALFIYLLIWWGCESASRASRTYRHPALSFSTGGGGVLLDSYLIKSSRCVDCPDNKN